MFSNDLSKDDIKSALRSHPECVPCAAEEVRVQTIADADCQSGSTRGSASSLEQYFSGAEVEKLLAQCAEKTAEHTAEKTAEHTAQKCARKFENALDIAHSTYAEKLRSLQSELEQKVSEIERLEMQLGKYVVMEVEDDF